MRPENSKVSGSDGLAAKEKLASFGGAESLVYTKNAIATTIEITPYLTTVFLDGRRRIWSGYLIWASELKRVGQLNFGR